MNARKLALLSWPWLLFLAVATPAQPPDSESSPAELEARAQALKAEILAKRGGTPPETEEERFARLRNFAALYADCRPVRFDVFNATGTERILDKQRTETMLESRLRVAGLRPDPGRHVSGWHPELVVSVHAMESPTVTAYHLRFEFRQKLDNPLAVTWTTAATWSRSATGYFGKSADPSGDAHARVSDWLDEFILEYLKVNDTALVGCPPPRP